MAARIQDSTVTGWLPINLLRQVRSGRRAVGGQQARGPPSARFVKAMLIAEATRRQAGKPKFLASCPPGPLAESVPPAEDVNDIFGAAVDFDRLVDVITEVVGGHEFQRVDLTDQPLHLSGRVGTQHQFVHDAKLFRR